VSLHYLVKYIISKNSKIVVYLTPFCFIVDKINQINLTVCGLLSHIKCQNVILRHGCMHGHAFMTLMKFMTSMN